jgi:hypothetical protein
MRSKYIKYIECFPSHWSKVKDYALCQYFKFVTSVHTFMVDYSEDERNIFVPNVEKLTHHLY